MKHTGIAILLAIGLLGCQTESQNAVTSLDPNSGSDNVQLDNQTKLDPNSGSDNGQLDNRTSMKGRLIILVGEPETVRQYATSIKGLAHSENLDGGDKVGYKPPESENFFTNNDVNYYDSLNEEGELTGEIGLDFGAISTKYGQFEKFEKNTVYIHMDQTGVHTYGPKLESFPSGTMRYEGEYAFYDNDLENAGLNKGTVEIDADFYKMAITKFKGTRDNLTVFDMADEDGYSTEFRIEKERGVFFGHLKYPGRADVDLIDMNARFHGTGQNSGISGILSGFSNDDGNGITRKEDIVGGFFALQTPIQ